MNTPFDIRNPDLAKLVSDAKVMDAELAMKIILAVDNALNIAHRNQGNDNANMTRRIIGVEESVQALRSELTHEREIRAKAELEAAERQVALAKQRLGGLTTDAKLEVKKIFEESLRTEVGEVLEDKEELTRIARAKWWQDTFSAAGRAIIIAVSVPVALGLLVGIILFLAKVFNVPL